MSIQIDEYCLSHKADLSTDSIDCLNYMFWNVLIELHSSKSRVLNLIVCKYYMFWNVLIELHSSKSRVLNLIVCKY